MAFVEDGPSDLTCQKCGAGMPLIAQFCGGCGATRAAAVSATPAPPNTPPRTPPPPPPAAPTAGPVCAKCLAPLVAGSPQFCGKCGTPVAASSPPRMAPPVTAPVSIPPPPTTPPLVLPPSPPPPTRGVVNLGSSSDLPAISSVDSIPRTAPFESTASPANTSSAPWEGLTPSVDLGNVKAPRKPREKVGIGVRIRSHPLLVLAASLLLILFSMYQLLGYFIARGTGPEAIAKEYVKAVITRNANNTQKVELFPSTGNLDNLNNGFQGWEEVAGLRVNSKVSWTSSSNHAKLSFVIEGRPELSFSVDLASHSVSKFVFFSSRIWKVSTPPGVINLDLSSYDDNDILLVNDKAVGSISVFRANFPAGSRVLPGIYRAQIDSPDGKPIATFAVKCLPPQPCLTEKLPS